LVNLPHSSWSLSHLNFRLQITRTTALPVVCLAGLFWHYSRLPLYHTDLWGHLAYGRWIAGHGLLPATEPFMPLAQRIPLIDTAWLSQLVAFGVYLAAGLAGLQVLHALAVVACCGILVWSVTRKTANPLAAGLALAVFVSLEWFQFRVIRPQMAGLVFFIALDALLTTRAGRRRSVWALPLLFVAWANLHGSFVTGLGLMAMGACGRIIDLVRRGQSLQRAVHDRRFAWLVRWTLIAAVASLLNPYGPRLYVEVLTFARNPNLRDLIEWAPLNLGTWQGRICIAGAVLLPATGLAAGRRITAANWLPIVAFGGGTLWSARMLVWWSPLVASLVALQANGIWRRFRRGKKRRPAASPDASAGWVWTVIATASVVLALAGSPLGGQFANERGEETFRHVSPETPVAAVAWLREHPPAGLVFNNYEWGDYLLWGGPPNVEPFVNSQVHLIPPAVWNEYRAISRAAPDCLDRLDAKKVGTVLLDHHRQQRLEERLIADPRWNRAYDDERAVIFHRRSFGRGPD
jgi:hypothetical protein